MDLTSTVLGMGGGNSSLFSSADRSTDLGLEQCVDQCGLAQTTSPWWTIKKKRGLIRNMNINLTYDYRYFNNVIASIYFQEILFILDIG